MAELFSDLASHGLGAQIRIIKPKADAEIIRLGVEVSGWLHLAKVILDVTQVPTARMPKSMPIPIVAYRSFNSKFSETGIFSSLGRATLAKRQTTRQADMTSTTDWIPKNMSELDAAVSPKKIDIAPSIPL